MDPPFHAVPIRNAIFAVYGGLAIDGQARVLGIANNPIPGLYARAPCAGGVMHEFYAGSIAHAGVTGPWAADAAAQAIQTAQGCPAHLASTQSKTRAKPSFHQSPASRAGHSCGCEASPWASGRSISS